MVAASISGKLGLDDVNVCDRELVFGVSIENVSKAERLTFGESHDPCHDLHCCLSKG